MSLRDAIRLTAGLGAELLMSRGTLTRRHWTNDAGMWSAANFQYDIVGSRQKAKRPYNAVQTYRVADARLHVSLASSEVEPIQNDEITLDGKSWIVWRVEDSPAGSHAVVDVVAPPAYPVIFKRIVEVDDGAGGSFDEPQTDADGHAALGFYRLPKETKSIDRADQEMVARAELTVLKYNAPTDLSANMVVKIGTETMKILAIDPDDENTEYLRLTLANRK